MPILGRFFSAFGLVLAGGYFFVLLCFGVGLNRHFPGGWGGFCFSTCLDVAIFLRFGGSFFWSVWGLVFGCFEKGGFLFHVLT